VRIKIRNFRLKICKNNAHKCSNTGAEHWSLDDSCDTSIVTRSVSLNDAITELMKGNG